MTAFDHFNYYILHFVATVTGFWHGRGKQIKEVFTKERYLLTKTFNKIINFTNESEVSSKVVLLKMKGMLLTLEQYSNYSWLELDSEVMELMLNQDVCEDDLDSEYESRVEYNENWNSAKVNCESILAIGLKK